MYVCVRLYICYVNLSYRHNYLFSRYNKSMVTTTYQHLVDCVTPPLSLDDVI